MTLRSSRPFALGAAAALAALATAGAHAIQFAEVRAAESRISFVSKQMGVPVEGQFARFVTRLEFDPAQPEAGKASIEIDLASIDAGSADANAEVAGRAWFDTANHPVARFESSSVKALGDGRFEVRGPLSLKGQTKDVVARFSVQQNGNTAVFEGGFPFRRTEFAVGDGAWADPSVVADEVQVRFRIVAEGH